MSVLEAFCVSVCVGRGLGGALGVDGGWLPHGITLTPKLPGRIIVTSIITVIIIVTTSPLRCQHEPTNAATGPDGSGDFEHVTFVDAAENRRAFVHV